jgi:hypothetical protein
MKKTAVQWFYTKLITGKFTGNDTIEFLYETAKEMEKEQIIDAYETSHISMMTAEQYYNETFNKKA